MLLCLVYYVTMSCLLCYYVLFAKLLCHVYYVTMSCLPSYYVLFAKLLCHPSYSVSIQVAHEDIPHGDEMAHASCKNEEMEDSMHVASFAQSIEQCARDIANALGDDPYHRGRTHCVYQRFEGHEHTHAHADVDQCLKVAMGFELVETCDGADDGTQPYKAEQCPSPIALVTQGDEGDGRVGTCDMPVDGGMVPLAQPFFPRRPCRQCMIHG